jgi:hypothetical protein
MDAYAGRSDSVLSPEMAREMLTPQIESHGLGSGVFDEGSEKAMSIPTLSWCEMQLFR